MKIFGYTFFEKDKKEEQLDIQASSRERYTSVGSWGVTFDGQKNEGDIGPIIDYTVDFRATSLRAWQAMLESDVARMIIKRMTLWVIGKGLRLQSEPNKKALQSERIIFDSQEFSEVIEARFGIYCESKSASHNGIKNLYQIQNEAYLNACVSGDILVIQRFVNGGLTIQIVDGCHLVTPYMYAPKSNNIIRNGVEINSDGEHVAFWVCTMDLNYERIPAKNSLGLQTAWLVYGDKHRIDDHRGVSRIVTILESLAKSERYKEATVGSAEEAAKISYQVIHQQYSSGDNPQLMGVAKAFDTRKAMNPATIDGEELANKVIATTNKQTINMPVGSEIKSLNQSNNTLYFKEFYMTLVECACGVVNIPPDVARSIYNSNFSASRAALKDWEHTLSVERYNFYVQFMQPIYEFYLYIQVITGKVQAEGYLTSWNENNIYIFESYSKARFVGATVPHIDPEKEVRAERLKLGDAGANIPLTTAEQATESLNSGSSLANIEQFAKEFELTKSLGIKPDEPSPVVASKEAQNDAP